MKRRQILQTAAAAVAASQPFVAGMRVWAQSFPSKTVRLVVPYPPGGATDFFARVVFAKVGDILGQQVIVENRPGAGGSIGAELVAKSAADGYTLLLGDMGTYALNATLYKNLRYDAQKDFAPVSLTARFAMVLVVNSEKTAAKSLPELLVRIRREPGKLNYAAPGPGSPLHMAMELFKRQANVQLMPIPYRGGGDAVTGLLSGQVDLMFLDIATARAQIAGGKIRALAVASEKRNPILPDVPTVAEAGVAGVEVYAWQGFVAPVGTPRDVIQRLNTAFASAIADPTIRQKLAEASAETTPSSPEQFAAYVGSETIRWGKIIRDAGISLE